MAYSESRAGIISQLKLPNSTRAGEKTNLMTYDQVYMQKFYHTCDYMYIFYQKKKLYHFGTVIYTCI